MSYDPIQLVIILIPENRLGNILTGVLTIDKQEPEMDEQILYAKATSRIENTLQGFQIQQTRLLMPGQLQNR